MQSILKAISDPTRRRILQLLREKPLTAGEIADHFPQAKPTLSRHFAILREANLLHGEKAGTTITYHLHTNVLEDALVELVGLFDLLPSQSPARKRKPQS
jgi:ArsR family transcriptional regulator